MQQYFILLHLTSLSILQDKEEAGGEQDLKGNQCDDQSLGNYIYSSYERSNQIKRDDTQLFSSCVDSKTCVIPHSCTLYLFSSFFFCQNLWT